MGMMTDSTLNLPAHESRADQELTVLQEIGQVLSSTLELREVFGKMMQLISDKLDMHRGQLVLLDDSSGRLRTEAALGMTPDEIERGKYALAEGSPGMSSRRAGRGSSPTCGTSRTSSIAPAGSATTSARRSASSACRSRSRAARPGPCRSTSRSSARSNSAA